MVVVFTPSPPTLALTAMVTQLQDHAVAMEDGIKKDHAEIERLNLSIAEKNSERTQAVAISEKLKALLGD